MKFQMHLTMRGAGIISIEHFEHCPATLFNHCVFLWCIAGFFAGAGSSQNVARNPRLAHLIAASIKTAMLVAAFYALGAALLQTGMFGVRGALVLDAMPIWAAISLRPSLSRSSGHRIGIGVRIAKRHRRRLDPPHFVLGALIFVIDHALEHVFVFNEVSAASISVLHFVLILLGAYVLSGQL